MNADSGSVSDEELARQSQAGSLHAFETLVYRYERRICGLAGRFLADPADAREVTQDTFVKAFQAIARYDPRQPFAPWLFTIARRACIDRQRAAPPRVVDRPPEIPETADPSHLLAQKEERDRIWTLARRVLPDLQYQALWFRYAEDLSVADVARVMRKTQVHIKVLLFRARQTLAAELGRPGREATAPVGVARRVASPAGSKLSLAGPKGSL